MSNQISRGPGGMPLADILDLADTLGRQIAALGITDPQDRNTFCSSLGDKLTQMFSSMGLAEELRPYEERLADVCETAFSVYLGPDALAACSALGPWRGPAMETQCAEVSTRAIMTSLVMMRKLIGVPASEFLDLVVWVQTAMSVPAFLDAHPELAIGLRLRRPQKRSKRRRFIRH